MTGPLLYLAEDGWGDVALWVDCSPDLDKAILYRFDAGATAWELIEEALVARLGRTEEKLAAVRSLADMWPTAHGRAILRALEVQA